MRHLRRLGILVAATTLAGTAVFAGAGMAGAQMPGEPADINLTSASAVSVSRVAGDIVVSYSNQSGRDLSCGVIVSNDAVIAELYEYYRTTELIIGDPIPPFPDATQEKILAAQLAGEFGSGNFDIKQGESGPVTWEEENPLVQPESQTFSPEALAMCGGDPIEWEDPWGTWATYSEMEVTTTGEAPGPGTGDGGGGLFGSVLGLLPALGS